MGGTLVVCGVKLALGSGFYDPVDPIGKMVFNFLATFAEFKADIIRLRTREGTAVACARGKLQGRHPKLFDKPQKELRPTIRRLVITGAAAVIGEDWKVR